MNNFNVTETLTHHYPILEQLLTEREFKQYLHDNKIEISKLVKQTSPIDRTKPKMSEGRNILKMIKDKINDE